LKIGILLDEPKIVPGFDYVFYEVKPSSGRVLKPLPKAWNVFNCFADNTLSQSNPDLVATSKGERALEERSATFSGTGYAQVDRSTGITARRRSKTLPNMMWQAYVWTAYASLAKVIATAQSVLQNRLPQGKTRWNGEPSRLNPSSGKFETLFHASWD
jgi:hypothetical protein